MGNDANRKHSETWDRITRDTMDTVRLDTRRLLSEIKEVVDVAKRGKKRKRTENEQGTLPIRIHLIITNKGANATLDYFLLI
jgi:hypothetical protein